MSIVCLVVELVLSNDPGGGKGNRNSHILGSVDGSGKVIFVDVKAHVFGLLGAQHSVPM